MGVVGRSKLCEMNGTMKLLIDGWFGLKVHDEIGSFDDYGDVFLEDAFQALSDPGHIAHHLRTDIHGHTTTLILR